MYRKAILCLCLFIAVGLNAIAQKFTKQDFESYYALLLSHARESGINVHGNLDVLQQAKNELWTRIQNTFSHTQCSQYYEATIIDKTTRVSEVSGAQKNDWVKIYKEALNIKKWHKDWEAHHIIPRSYGGTNDWWNIMPLQQTHHRGPESGIHYSAELQKLFPITQ